MSLPRHKRRRSDTQLRAVRSEPVDVLFVDDDGPIGRAFQRSFGRLGLKILVETSPREAIELARTQPLKVVVTDLRMPGMDGMALIEELRSIQPNLLFIIVTGMPDMDLKRSPAADPAILATFGKPWNEGALAETMRRGVELFERRLEAPQDKDILSVLVLDDNELEAAYLKRELEQRCDAQVVVLRRLREALALLVTRRFDVVLAELALPDARGTDVVVHLLRVAEEQAVIVLSATDERMLARQALKAGAQDFLVKGALRPDALPRVLLSAVDRAGYVRTIHEQARFDQLTGLANRATLKSFLDRVRAQARQEGLLFGLLCIDLDHFSRINDNLGHEAGNSLLRQAGERLRRNVRDHDLAARVGGDEFAVLLTNLESPDSAIAVSERLLEAMNEPFHLADTNVVVTLSVGSVVTENAETTLDELFRAADLGMYKAKHSGRNQSRSGGLGALSLNVTRLAMEEELRVAVRERSFTLAYQPQFSAVEGRLVGYEALLRWRRGDGTSVSPASFVPILEELGLICDVGEWVLTQAALRLSELRARGLSNGVRMGVNLSGHQFERAGLLDAVQSALTLSKLEPSALELEITENVLMKDTQQTGDALTGLKKLGVGVAIDDFGTGYSSLAYLKRFAVDRLKIDRCFVQDLSEQSGGCIAAAVISLGHRLGMEVVAEGVERTAQLEHLRGLGCDVIQGFLLGGPEADPFRPGSKY